MIFYFYFNLSYNCYRVLHIDELHQHIPPLIPFSTINSLSVLVNNSKFTSAFFEAA